MFSEEGTIPDKSESVQQDYTNKDREMIDLEIVHKAGSFYERKITKSLKRPVTCYRLPVARNPGNRGLKTYRFTRPNVTIE
jgi:hypothetical protein